MTSVAKRERRDLCELLEAHGPLAPTLCEGWTTSDLVAHLFVRERRPFAAAGILVPALAQVTERAMERAKGQLGYSGLIARVRSGPPPPFGLFDERANVLELFIHHEDVRRAQDGWEPRREAALDAAIWPVVRLGSRLMARRLHGVGLELAAPGFGNVVAKRAQLMARVSGLPSELAVFMTGRQRAARVQIEGPDGVTSRIEDAPFGL
ncbi:MAG: TIGR03085 family metal-binding protein [Acidimicrobiales bacterium]